MIAAPLDIGSRWRGGYRGGAAQTVEVVHPQLRFVIVRIVRGPNRARKFTAIPRNKFLMTFTPL